MQIALKIDVDTLRGTREGVPRLVEVLERAGAQATFLFSLGPDHTGRALRRIFRPGFFGKVRRTSVVRHYGIRTLLYGVLLPGPHIGRSCAPILREVAARGFEVGVHVYDHVRWQDGVAAADSAWTRRELDLAREAFIEVFGMPPVVHGAAGWQLNDSVPLQQQELGFRYASDVRGDEPFLPVIGGRVVDVPQIPTTLPTFDELIGTPELGERDPVSHLLEVTRRSRRALEVYTAHAELEGGAFLASFERLLREWRRDGMQIVDLATAAASLDHRILPCRTLATGTVPGRSGTLAVEGPPAASS
ncbi:MAG: polysaccharide deacetylase family protein [Steroidobacteraceae bacterium]